MQVDNSLGGKNDVPRGKKPDPLRRKWQWARAQWEVAKETGVVDDSRRQLVLPAMTAGNKPTRHPTEEDEPEKAP